VRETVLGARSHAELPFERLIDELGVERSLSHTPLFQAVLNFEDARSGGKALRLGDVEVEPFASEGETAKFDLTMRLVYDGERIAGALGYRTTLFDAATIERHVSHLVRLLEQVSTRADVRLSELDLLDDAERRQVLEAWNATERRRIR
jgi:non-ribosomal peptide synthetase component F